MREDGEDVFSAGRVGGPHVPCVARSLCYFQSFESEGKLVISGDVGVSKKKGEK